MESDAPMSGYYYKNPMSLSFETDSAYPVLKQKSHLYHYIQSDMYPPFGIESFNNHSMENYMYIFILICIIILFLAVYMIYHK